MALHGAERGMMAETNSKPADDAPQHRARNHDETYVVTVPTNAFDPTTPQLVEQANEQLAEQITAKHGDKAEVTESEMAYEHVVGSHVAYTFAVKVKA